MGVVRRLAAIFACAALTACGVANVKLAAPPDAAVLSDAEAMTAAALDAGAQLHAPRVLREARRHLAVARGLLFQAAREGRAPTEAEAVRVERLAGKAYMDARLALARSRAETVRGQLAELQAQRAVEAVEAAQADAARDDVSEEEVTP